MKDKMSKPDVVESAEALAVDKANAEKKKKKDKKGDEPAALKEKKAKPEKSDKKIAGQEAPKAEKLPKAPKDDKLTKFLVSMKKSVRKSVKKEAAEAGVSMNEYIVLAVVEKLGKNPPESGTAPLKKP